MDVAALASAFAQTLAPSRVGAASGDALQAPDAVAAPYSAVLKSPALQDAIKAAEAHLKEAARAPGYGYAVLQVGSGLQTPPDVAAHVCLPRPRRGVAAWCQARPCKLHGLAPSLPVAAAK
jgi:hypothetical protein